MPLTKKELAQWEALAKKQSQDSILKHVREGAHVCTGCRKRYFTREGAMACCGKPADIMRGAR